MILYTSYTPIIIPYVYPISMPSICKDSSVICLGILSLLILWGRGAIFLILLTLYAHANT